METLEVSTLTAGLLYLRLLTEVTLIPVSIGLALGPLKRYPAFAVAHILLCISLFIATMVTYFYPTTEGLLLVGTTLTPSLILLAIAEMVMLARAGKQQ